MSSPRTSLLFVCLLFLSLIKSLCIYQAQSNQKGERLTVDFKNIFKEVCTYCFCFVIHIPPAEGTSLLFQLHFSAPNGEPTGTPIETVIV